MPEIVWVGPGWYKILTFAVGDQKVTQASPNKEARIEDAFWCSTHMDCIAQFTERQQRASKRELY